MSVDKRNQNVVKFFLREVLGNVKRNFNGAKIEWTIPEFFTVKGSQEIIEQVVSYIEENYNPQIGISMVDDSTINVYRDRHFTLAGDCVSASAKDTGNGRHRINSGFYKWEHGQTIERNFNKPCEAKHSWIVKGNDGTVLCYSPTLRDAWGYLESNFPL